MANMKMLTETTYAKSDVMDYLESTGYPYAAKNLDTAFGWAPAWYRITETRLAEWFKDYFPFSINREQYFREMQAAIVGHVVII